MREVVMKLLNLDFTRIAHDTFRIAGSKVVYTDPFKVSKGDEADIVLLSHEHFDHLSKRFLLITSTSFESQESPSIPRRLKGSASLLPWTALVSTTPVTRTSFPR
jgi:hypothetical protein